MARTLTLALLLALFVGSVAFFGFITLRSSENQQVENSSPAQPETLTPLSEPSVTFIDPIRGNTSASVTIVEFGDYFCEFCKEIEPVITAVLATYPDKVRLVWKDMPNDSRHAEATKAAASAHCAGEQGKYWEYHDALFARITPGALIAYPEIAESIGINRGAFELCLNSDRLRPRVFHSLGEAQRLNITGTPAFYINGKSFSGTTFEEFTDAIDRLIEAE